MDSKHRRTLKSLIHKLGLKYKLSDEIIKHIIESPYEFTFEKLSSLDLKEIDSEEKLINTKTNFSYKALGKLYISYPVLKKRNKQIEHITDLNNKKWKK